MPHNDDGLKLDMDAVNRILDLLLTYWGRKPGMKDSNHFGWLDISQKLDDESEQHPREYFKAEKIYTEQYAPRKQRKNRELFHE